MRRHIHCERQHDRESCPAFIMSGRIEACHKNNAVFVTMKKGDSPHYTDHSILDAVRADKFGSAFAARDFLKLGSVEAAK